jgi:aspartate/methionine/tyrosine aminotransferase
MDPRFSDRTAWPSGFNEIARAVDERRIAGDPIIDLTETNPTRVGLPPIAPELLTLLGAPGSAGYDPQPAGLLATREAIAAYHQHQVPPEHVCVTASTSEAYTWLFKLLCNPGDSVLVPSPSYPLFEHLGQMESVRITSYATRSWDDWSIDFDALARAADDSTRTVIIVSPNNPTGAMLHAADRKPLLDFCERRGLALISDEVFADFAEPRPDRVPSVAGTNQVLSFVLSGLSKVCLLPQLKLGWIAASGPAGPRDEALRRLDLIADHFLSVNTPVQRAAPALLSHRSEIQAALCARLSANRRTLGAVLAGTEATLLPADGGWAAVLRVPRTKTEDAWVLDLLARGVLVHPGYFFDFAEPQYLVVSLIVEEATFAQACRVLRETMRI